jgi:hypothetical protein
LVVAANGDILWSIEGETGGRQVRVLRRRGHLFAALLGVLGFALLLPGRAAPMHERAADTVTIGMSAPTSVVHGNYFDYTITATYDGEPSGVTADYTVTDALPAQVHLVSAGITNGTCTMPPSGQSGTVACTFKFAPLTKTSTITITVEAADIGTATNTAQLSSGGTASAATSVGGAPAGSVNATLTGPETIKLSATVAPARFNYTLALAYTGPPIRGAVFASFVERLPDQITSPAAGTGFEGLRDQCKGDDPPRRTGATLTCNFYFTEDHRTRTIELSARPIGTSGSATNVVEFSTGETARWTTTIEPPPAEPAQQSAPAPVAGPPAAPTATVAESFTTAGTSEPETVTVSPTAETVQIALTWSNGSSSFDLVGFTLSSPARTLAASEKLRVTKKRSAKWLDVRIKGVHKGKLKFRIVAKRVHGRTKVVAKIRQSKR